MPLGQFNALLSGCGYEPVSLDGEYIIVTNTMEIVDTDFHDVTLTLNGESYAYARTEKNYPEFVLNYVYAVVPDEAAAGMEVYNACVSCQLANSDFDVQAMSQELSHALWDTNEENDSDYFIKQEYRDWVNSNSGGADHRNDLSVSGVRMYGAGDSGNENAVFSFGGAQAV